MLNLSGLREQDMMVPDDFKWIHNAYWEPKIISTQDSSHILVKLYRRIHRHILVMGEKNISLNFLKILLNVDNTSDTNPGTKSKFGICLSDLESADTMSMKFAEKVCTDRVIQGLAENVPNSEGMILYLKIMKAVQIAFISPQTAPAERMYYSYWILLICRIWRFSLTDDRNLKSFISSNTYNSIELNCQGMLCYLKKCRERNEPHLFLPELIGSQMCESFFRLERSQTTTYCTKTNFDIFEFLGRVKRTHVLMMSKANCGDFKIAREAKNNLSIPPTTLPSNDEILKIIENALKDAFCEFSKLGEFKKGRLIFYNIL